MASISGLDLETSSQRFVAGAAYRLSRSARVNYRWVDESGIEVVCQRNRQFAAVMIPVTAQIGDVKAITYDAAQRALDVLSVQRLDDLTLPGGHEGEIEWRRDHGELVVRCYLVTELGFSATASLATPNPENPTRPGVNYPRICWREPFRYFRVAQTTGDVHEAYRNMYLAFECILSGIEPRQHHLKNGRPEGERKWLDRALQRISSLIARVLPNAADHVLAFRTQQYEALRCALFHAKEGTTAILPGSPDNRPLVVKALEDLSALVSVMIEQEYGIFRNASGATPYVIAQFAQAFATTMRMGVTEQHTDPSAINADYLERTPVSELADSRYAGPSDPVGYEHIVVGKACVKALSSRTVNAVVSWRPDTPGITSYAHIDTLNLSDVDVLEVAQIFALYNRAMPRTRFHL